MEEWKETCAKCRDGEIEPECAYYGEPNGCNSPIYGEYPPVGNTAVLRETLIWMKERIIAAIHDGVLDCSEVLNKIDEALAKPPRNCDVGTESEQYRRWVKFCEKHYQSCHNCPCRDADGCTFVWSQMPNVADREGVGA